MRLIYWFSLFVLVCLGEQKDEAEPVRVSFLNDTNALVQTLDFLYTNGCDVESLRLFESAVRGHNESPLGFDIHKFPKSENGFYSFQSMSNLLDSLPEPILTAHHVYQMDCFDAVILLAGYWLKTDLQPDAPCGPFLVPVAYPNFTNFLSTMAVEETPRDAFNCNPAWYIEGSKKLFSGARQDERVCLSVVLNSYCILPQSTKQDKLTETLFSVLKSTWKKQGVVFPTNSEVIICHSAVLNSSGPAYVAPYSNTTHAGLLFKNGSKFLYLEKAGVTGPYVRLDLADRKDLLTWLSSVIAPSTDARDTLFVTFNDTGIEPLDNINH